MLVPHRGGPDHRDHRAQRGGENHHIQHGGGGAGAVVGADPVRRRGHRGPPHPRDVPPRHRPHLPDPSRVRPADGARESDGGARHPAGRAAVAGVDLARAGAAARARGPGAGGGDAAVPHPVGGPGRARRASVRWAEETARTRAGDDDRAAAGPPRRARRGGQPDPDPQAPRHDSTPQPAPRVHLRHHRARHGPYRLALRAGHRARRGVGADRGIDGRGAPRSARDRRLPRGRRSGGRPRRLANAGGAAAGARCRRWRR